LQTEPSIGLVKVFLIARSGARRSGCIAYLNFIGVRHPVNIHCLHGFGHGNIPSWSTGFIIEWQGTAWDGGSSIGMDEKEVIAGGSAM
jgi:hypothetical protein